MKSFTFIMVCLNIAILTIFYTLFGGLFSFMLKHIFNPFDEQWKTFSLGFKIGEIALELICIGVIAYWSMFFIEKAPPIFPVSNSFDKSVDTYISGIFFVYAIFLFFDHLSGKIQHVYNHSVNIILRKNGPMKDQDTKHQDGMYSFSGDR